MRAVTLAIQNPPPKGNCKIINQLTEVFSVNQIALMVQQLTGCEVKSIDNPRTENEYHTYNPTFDQLEEWGLSDPFKMEQMLPRMLENVKPFVSRISKDVITPKTKWRGTHYAR
jgi:UDP-sulfoquinovose synthase